MKKVICLFLLFLFVQSKTDIDESIAHFYDIEYNKKYIVDITKYSWGYLPENHRYYFRVAVNENDKMQVECRVLRNAIVSFDIDICPFSYWPSNYEVWNAREYATNCAALDGTKSYETNYDIYKYPFQTLSGHKYLSIYLLNRKALHYLDVYVYSEKGLAAGIIAVIVIVPTVVVIGIIYAICQKMGCIRKDDHFSSDDINVSPVTNNYI